MTRMGENESVTIGNAASGGGYNGKSADYSATVTDDDTKGLTTDACEWDGDRGRCIQDLHGDVGDCADE